MNDSRALQEHYATLDDDELRFIATKPELTEAAQSALDQELKRRGITDVMQYKHQLEQETITRQEYLAEKLASKQRAIRMHSRIAYAFCIVLFLVGAARYFIEGNERDGIGIMIASVIVAPIYWVSSFLRRLAWRFMLRS